MVNDISDVDRLCRVFCNVIEEIVTARALEGTNGVKLSRAQFDGLQYVYLHPKCCIRDLACGLSVSHPAAVKLVERLESRGLVTRAADKRDRRVVQLKATRAGSRQAAATIAARGEAIERIAVRAGGEGPVDLQKCLCAFVRAALESERDTSGVCLRCGGGHSDDCPVCQAELELLGRLRSDS